MRIRRDSVGEIADEWRTDDLFTHVNTAVGVNRPKIKLTALEFSGGAVDIGVSVSLVSTA